jgi:hypothetical protein
MMMKWSLIAAVLYLASLGVSASAAPTPFEGGAPLPPTGEIDKLVFGRLAQLGIQPANLCSDAVFVRRAYLDVIGTLPTAQDARAFIQDPAPGKRAALIERLLARPEFADTWAMKWGDLLRVKAEFPINLWPNAVQAYHRWIREAVRTNMPYDRFARELLTASGSNFRVGPVNFYRAVQNKEPQALAQAVALTFMGVRAEKWPKERLAGMAGFFAQVGYKATGEWKEEIVYFDPARPAARAVFPDGTPARLAADQDPREAFANWLIDAKNPWFTRNIANRVWSWLLGRGIIQEPDDIRDDNPPSNPELLACLERELVAAHYDLRQLYRLILNSQTYQLASIPRSSDPRAEANFAAYPLRRLEAEVLIDALCQLTGTTEKYSSATPEPFSFIPEEQRSIALDDGSISSSFLELFGRAQRDTGLESERNNRPSSAQRLHLLNSSHIQRKIEQGRGLQALMQSGRGNPREAVDNLYLAILSRYPTPEELQTVAEYARRGGGKAGAIAPAAPAAQAKPGRPDQNFKAGKSARQPWAQGQGRGPWNRPAALAAAPSREAAIDLAWALINSPEFLYRH